MHVEVEKDAVDPDFNLPNFVSKYRLPSISTFGCMISQTPPPPHARGGGLHDFGPPSPGPWWLNQRKEPLGGWGKCIASGFQHEALLLHVAGAGQGTCLWGADGSLTTPMFYFILPRDRL